MRSQNLFLTLLLILAISVALPACSSSSSSSTDETPAVGGPGEEPPVFGSPTQPTLLFTPLPPGYEKTAIPPTLQSKTPSAKPQQTPTPVPKASPSATKPPSPTSRAASTPNAVASATKTAQTLGLIIKDGNISLSSSGLQIGKVQVTVENGGVDLHAIAIKGPGIDTRTDQIDPGKAVNKEITIDQPGSFELYCPVDGHRQKGESVMIQVK